MSRSSVLRALSGPFACLMVAIAACRSAPLWSALSPDHRSVVTVSKHRGRSCVAVGARADGCYDGVAIRTFTFDTTGAHVAYAARVGHGWTIVRDGRPSSDARWEGVGTPQLSRDGQRLAYPALAQGRWHVVVDGTPGPQFDAILARTLMFDPTGRRVAYAASRRDRVHVVVDDTLSREWRTVARLAFDSTGSAITYVASDSMGWRIVSDGWASPLYEAIAEVALGAPQQQGPTASPAVKLAYTARKEGRWRVHFRASESTPFDSVRALAVTNDGDVVYVARLGTRESFVRRDHLEGWYDAIGTPAASPDGRWGYLARDGGGDSAAVVIDGQLIARTQWAGSDLAIGRGARRAYLALDGDRTVVVDERGRYPFDVVIAGTLQFTRDGTAWFALAGDRRRRELFVVVDGERVGAGRPLAWSEIVRLAEEGGPAALRRSIATEAEHFVRGVTTPEARKAPAR